MNCATQMYTSSPNPKHQRPIHAQGMKITVVASSRRLDNGSYDNLHMMIDPYTHHRRPRSFRPLFGHALFSANYLPIPSSKIQGNTYKKDNSHIPLTCDCAHSLRRPLVLDKVMASERSSTTRTTLSDVRTNHHYGMGRWCKMMIDISMLCSLLSTNLTLLRQSLLLPVRDDLLPSDFAIRPWALPFAIGRGFLSLTHRE